MRFIVLLSRPRRPPSALASCRFLFLFSLFINSQFHIFHILPGSHSDQISRCAGTKLNVASRAATQIDAHARPLEGAAARLSSGRNWIENWKLMHPLAFICRSVGSSILVDRERGRRIFEAEIESKIDRRAHHRAAASRLFAPVRTPLRIAAYYCSCDPLGCGAADANGIPFAWAPRSAFAIGMAMPFKLQCGFQWQLGRLSNAIASVSGRLED